MRVFTLVLFTLLGTISALYVENTFQLSGNNGKAYAATQAGDYAYFGTKKAIVEFDLKTDTQTRSLSHGFVDAPSVAMTYLTDGDDYVIFGDSRGSIMKINTETMVVDSTVNVNSALNAAVTWGDYGFVAGRCVHKIGLSDLSTGQYNCNYDSGILGFLDGFVYGDSLYFTSTTTGLAKYDANTLTGAYLTDLTDVWLNAAVVVGDYAYIGTWGSKVIKFDLIEDNLKSIIDLPDVPIVSVAFSYGNYVYFGSEFLTQVAVSDRSIVQSVESPDAWFREALVVGEHVYLTSYNTENLVWKVLFRTYTI